MPTELISFAGGCFWGVEHAFAQVPGVCGTTCGYQGGETKNPDYREVCGGGTGHAEVVRVGFDPRALELSRLLRAFWLIHDPTQKDRQGPDIGDQYRSAIFCTTPRQVLIAEKSLAEETAKRKRPLTTQISLNADFYPAEEEHQKYLIRHSQGYCHIDPALFPRLAAGDF